MCRSLIAGCSRTRSSSRSGFPAGPASWTAAISNGSPGSGSSRVCAPRPAWAAATRRLNRAAPQPMCSARLSGSEAGMARSRSARSRRRRSAVSKRKRQGCALCMDGAAVASATSAITVLSSSCVCCIASSSLRTPAELNMPAPSVQGADRPRVGAGRPSPGPSRRVIGDARLHARPARERPAGPVMMSGRQVHPVETVSAHEFAAGDQFGLDADEELLGRGCPGARAGPEQALVLVRIGHDCRRSGDDYAPA